MRIAFLLLLACGCATLKTLTLSPPSLSFREARVDRADFDGADVTFVYQVQNPNSSELRLTGVAYALDLEGHTLLAGRPPEGLRIPPGDSAVEFPAHVLWLPLLAVLQTQPGVVHYKASGTLDVDTALGHLTLPISHEGTLPAPRLPVLALQSPRLLAVNPLGATLSIPLRIGNPNPFPLPLAGIACEVKISGAVVGRIDSPAQGIVDAASERIVTIPLKISFLSAGLAVARWLQSNEVEIALDGSLTIGSARLPLHLQQTLQLQR
jgi:LEA14-like dessication related protein